MVQPCLTVNRYLAAVNLHLGGADRRRVQGRGARDPAGHIAVQERHERRHFLPTGPGATGIAPGAIGRCADAYTAVAMSGETVMLLSTLVTPGAFQAARSVSLRSATERVVPRNVTRDPLVSTVT